MGSCGARAAISRQQQLRRVSSKQLQRRWLWRERRGEVWMNHGEVLLRVEAASLSLAECLRTLPQSACSASASVTRFEPGPWHGGVSRQGGLVRVREEE